MRLRSSSIRARIIALLLVPIVALAGLWAYAMLVTTGGIRAQLRLSATYKQFGEPADKYARDLQVERRAAVLKLAAGYTKSSDDAFQAAQAATDQDLALLKSRSSGELFNGLNSQERTRYQDLLAKGDLLAGIRSRARQGLDGWDQMLAEYSDLITPVFAFRTGFVSRQAGEIPRQGTILVELSRAREFLSQETTAMEALRIAPGSDERRLQVALDAMHSQQALFRIYTAELDPGDQQAYLDVQSSLDWDVLHGAEQAFEDAPDRMRAVRTSPGDPWGATADKVLSDLSEVNNNLATGVGDRAKSAAITALVRGGVAGVLGLLAAVLSVVISYRIGRKLARELISLRDSALELSGTRLPSVMLRLRRGEPVDVALETPPLELGPGEIGQVGRAFTEVQRVAVEAAVEQADLRRGVSAVFVNLARRSQVLLHRQLTLLDTMERRTEDSEVLEDLFRLDHLTTRMRRHAEGLIILSGGSPGRAWRKPVRMVDVVRAAVGEVEDYARVVLRPFPGTGLLGSAVADVTHLVAELVENAAVYSPPHTQVTVHGEVVAHGFCLEIDDRGLGLSAQALEEINQRLEVEQEFDLADTDRLGLFVVSRLARRHGIRVHLRPSPYGGTSAVVLIPRELLAEAVDPVSLPVPDLEPEPEVRPAGGPRPALVEPARTPGGLPRRRSAAGPTATGDAPAGIVSATGADDTHDDERGDSADGGNGDGHDDSRDDRRTVGGRHRRADSPAEERVRPTNPAHAARPQAVPGGLPRRVRQANLAPQLREDAEAAHREAGRERSPEEARSAFASFQRGFQRGRGDRLQPASLTVVPDRPLAALPGQSAQAERPAPGPTGQAGAAGATGKPGPTGPVRLAPMAALPSAPVPAALPAGPHAIDRTDQAVQARPAQPAPAEGTDS